MSWDRDAVIVVARTPEIHALVRRCALGELPMRELYGRVQALGFTTTPALWEMVKQQERIMAKPPPLDVTVLKPEQQQVIAHLEQAMRIVGEFGAGTVSADQNPVYRHPYQRAAMRALESAHSECLNWFDRANRGFEPVLATEPPVGEPEVQE